MQPKILTITHLPKPILRKTSEAVSLNKIKSPEIQNLIVSMKETLKNTPDGVGLAAPQVDESLRIFIVSEEAEYVDNKKMPEGIERKSFESDKKPIWKYFVYINPVVKKFSRN